MAYTGVTVNDERARELLADSGRTSDAVLQQAVPVIAEGELHHRLKGPADTGCAGVSHEHIATVDGDEVSEDEDELDLHAALPDEEFSQSIGPEQQEATVNTTCVAKPCYRTAHCSHCALNQPLQKRAMAMQRIKHTRSHG